MTKKVVVIGSGFAGLSASASLAQKGYQVTLVEKNATLGGRARKFSAQGFTFDMGPSWYWMPEVFEKYFNRFGYKVSDFYQLKRLDPSYQVFFQDGSTEKIPADFAEFLECCERLEPGSRESIMKFLDEGKYKYEVGINDLVYRPGQSITELLDWRLATGVFKLQVFSSIAKHIRHYFKDSRLIQLLEFPVLFLGAKPADTPALYSLMNYADIKLGTWYPMGGMHKIIEGMVTVVREQGVNVVTDAEVLRFFYEGKKIIGVKTTRGTFECDLVVNGADYHHCEQLLSPEFRSYSEKYWENRKMAPSSLIYYLGVDKEIPGLEHHNLFFDKDFDGHASEIYDEPAWPKNPLFYTCCPSKTDSSVAPEGKENLFLLVPVAPGLSDNPKEHQRILNMMLDRLEAKTKTNIRDHIIYKKSYAHKEFIEDYHAFKGNAYGLANTLTQTANLKPSLRSKKVSNLFHTGQLTVPGPGVPPSLISGQVVASEVEKHFPHEATV